MRKKIFFNFLCSSVLVFAAVAVPARAEELSELMKRVQEYAAQENYARAIEELAWVQKELEKKNLKKVEQYFPNEVAGFTGGAFSPNSTMGINNLEREYKKGDQLVTVSLTGSSSAGSPLGGLAGLGKMAAMMGAQGGMDTFRIDGRTASLSEEGSPQLTVFLDSGSVLEISGGSADELKAVAAGFDIEKLDNYLRGQG